MAVKPRAQLLGFTQTVGIVTAVLFLARVGLPRCKLLVFLAQFASFNALSLSSTPLLWSLRVVKRSYKLSKPSGTACSFRRKLRQLTKLLVRINLHRGYPTITQLVFWSSAENVTQQYWCVSVTYIAVCQYYNLLPGSTIVTSIVVS
jgi:hypothetical protein